jgi:hypothetical protein
MKNLHNLNNGLEPLESTSMWIRSIVQGRRGYSLITGNIRTPDGPIATVEKRWIVDSRDYVQDQIRRYQFFKTTVRESEVPR